MGDSEWPRWVRYAERIERRSGDVLFYPGIAASHIYFPVTAVVSLMIDLQDGSTVEFGMVGSEGLVGFSLFLTIPLTYGSAVVQHPGALYRVTADVALSQFEDSPPFRRALIRYMQFLVLEAAQNSSCYRHHSIEQQLCRSLLSYRDTQGSSQLSLTHEALARTLGVRREGITLAARRLQDLGFIQYARGHVEILSPLGLQAHSCECYHVLKEARERIFRPGRVPLA